MKKKASIVLAGIMLMSLAVPTFAAETNTHELIYQNDASYEISIPASSNIDIVTGKGTIDIGVLDTNLEKDTLVSVIISSDNYSDGNWNLVNTKDSSDKIVYTIGTSDGLSDVSNGDEVVATAATGNNTLYVNVSDTSKVGTFTDVITFTSEIRIDWLTFTIDGEVYHSEKNMTWGEWVDSEWNVDSKFAYPDFAYHNTLYRLKTSDSGYAVYDYTAGMLLEDELILEGEYYVDYDNLDF